MSGHTRHCWLDLPQLDLPQVVGTAARSQMREPTNPRCRICRTRLVTSHGPRLHLGDGAAQVPSITLVRAPVMLVHCHICGWANVWAASHASMTERMRAQAVAEHFNRNWRDQRKPTSKTS